MIRRAKAPVRVDFAGGWTDVIDFCQDNEGAVVNATINYCVFGEIISEPGMQVRYDSALPSGSGLGTSATLNVVWLSLIDSKADFAKMENKVKIAEMAHNLEKLFGILGGKQDQYASALGGFTFLKFKGNNVEIESLKVDKEFVNELEKRFVLCYTGKSRLSGDIHEKVWGAFRKKEESTTKALFRLRDIAYEVKDALLEKDLVKLGKLIDENWQNQKRLHPSVTNKQIDELFEIAYKNGAIGGKACGAGGGGCLLFLCEDRARVESALSGTGVSIFDFKFDFNGLQVWR